MKVTTIRLRKLASMPDGYGHHAVEIEAQVEPGEAIEVAAAQLHAEVDQQLATLQGRTSVRQSLDDMQDEVEWQREERRRLDAEVSRLHGIVAAHQDLAELAEERGLNLHGLPLPVPF